MAITSAGVGSGLDVNGLVSQLMAIESRPLTLLDRKEAAFQAKISALGTLKGSLSSLLSAASSLIPSSTQTASARFTTFRTSVADATLASASASTDGAAGTYSLEISQLAKAQRLSKPGSALTIVPGTLTIELGTYDMAAMPLPTFTRKTGTSETTITIDATNDTLQGVRDAINATSTGVKASIVTGSSGDYLILESGSGTQNALRITGTAGIVYDAVAEAASPGTNTLDQAVAAKDATLKINGIDVTSQSNTITGAIDGLTITLLKGPEAPATSVSTTLTISRDTSSVTSSLNALIKAYNDAQKTIRDLGSYNAQTKVAGILNGETTPRSAQSILRGIVNTVPAGLTGDYRSLSSIGINMARDGSLSLDASKLNAALEDDFSAVATSIAAFGTSFKNALGGLVGSNGIVNARTEGLNASIKSIDSQRDTIERRLTLTEVRLRRQFSSLDALISGMTRTSAALQQQLANLPGFK